MSWSIFNVQGTRRELATLIEEARPSGQDASDVVVERNQQVRIAKDVAFDIVQSDALFSGDPGDRFNVNMNGHANPEHKDRDGWANDYVQVNVSRVK